MDKINKFILFLALITPAMPKLKIAEGLTMYPLEIFLLLFFPLLFRKIRLKIQFFLFALWTITLLSTLVSFSRIVDFGGFFRCIKGIIYIPLVYLVYQMFKNKTFNFKYVIYIFILASVNNLFILIANGIDFVNLNIWDVKVIGSGLSNRFLDLKTFKIGTIESGAHGIWGNYCVIIFSLSLYLKLSKKIGNKLFIITLICFILDIGMSVSRETMITFILVFGSLFFVKDEKNTNLRNKTALSWIFIFAILIIITIGLWGDKLPIVQKILYTQESIQDSGTENNFQLRINGWFVYFESLIRNPERIFIGYGYNLESYANYVSFAKRSYQDSYVALPESFFIQTFCYGGILCLVLGILFWVEIFKTCHHTKIKNLRIILLFYFIGLLIGNTISGASILSDVLYCQILMLLGYLKTCNHEKNIINNSEK